MARSPVSTEAPLRAAFGAFRVGEQATVLSCEEVSLSTLSFPTTILFGAGAVNQLPDELRKRAIKRPLVVTDAGLARTPMFARVAALVPDVPVFSQVEPNPTEQNVLDGVEAYRRNACDGIIGVGGGSPLDAAKAIRLKVTHDAPLAEYDD